MMFVTKKKNGVCFLDKEFRLGGDCGQGYVNQYTNNPLVLNKLQHNEDRDKKRHLSHKFSVSSTQEFKWSGNLYGMLRILMFFLVIRELAYSLIISWLTTQLLFA